MTNNSTDHYSKFLLIWFGQFISIIGSGLTTFSLGVYVYQQTGTTSSYVFILMCAFLPPFLLKPYGGILADRHDRRLMMIFGDFGSTLGLLFIFIMMLKGNIELWQIYLGIAILFRAISHAEYIHAGDHYKALKHLNGGFVANSMAAFRKFPKGELIL